MKNIKSLCIRFNLLKDRDKSVWDILHSLDKKKWKSYSSAVITSVADFFDRQNKVKDDPYFETREREEKFVSEIVEAVERAMNKKLPEFLSVCFGEILRQYSERGGSNSAPAPLISAVSESTPEISESELSSDNDYSDVDLEFMNE